MSRIIAVLVVLSVMFGACTHTVNVALRPDFQTKLEKKNQLADVKPAVKFMKGSYADKRRETGTLTTFKEGIHTYNFYEERPVSEALFEGLETLITGSGHEWMKTGVGDVQIDAQLLNLQARRDAGFVMVSASSSVQIKLDFIEKKTGTMLYTQVYNGADDREQALIGMIDMVVASLDAAIVKCINDVGADEGLSKALKKVNKPVAVAE